MTDQKQADFTILLRDVRRELGQDTIDKLLPAPLQISIASHDTGCQITIFAKERDLKPVAVWYGSVWYSSAYMFNDRDRILGIQPEFKEAESIIDTFVERVAALYLDDKKAKSLEESRRLAQKEVEAGKLTTHYLNRLKAQK